MQHRDDRKTETQESERTLAPAPRVTGGRGPVVTTVHLTAAGPEPGARPTGSLPPSPALGVQDRAVTLFPWPLENNHSLISLFPNQRRAYPMGLRNRTHKQDRVLCPSPGLSAPREESRRVQSENCQHANSRHVPVTRKHEQT